MLSKFHDNNENAHRFWDSVERKGRSQSHTNDAAPVTQNCFKLDIRNAHCKLIFTWGNALLEDNIVFEN
jgi:hypothetical protein